jgi:hypothetical protein
LRAPRRAEIDDVAPDRVLPAESDAVQLMIAHA